jgi:hypothetical protein
MQNQASPVYHPVTQTLVCQLPPNSGVLIFKTNINSHSAKQHIGKMLNKQPLISQWSIDMEDIDCVLRIVSAHLNHQDIIHLVNRCGFYCQELVG